VKSQLKSERTALAENARAVRFVSWQQSDTNTDDRQRETETPEPGVARRARDLVKQILSSSKSPAKAWDEAFQSRKYASSVLAEAIYILHRQEKYDIAVEGLLSSLRNDHSQPWTYDVLATEMGLAGRPQEEIERVLVSRVDFATSSAPQMMLTAAMLARMDARPSAIQLCRQAAESRPFLAEPWLLGRKIADGTDDIRAQADFRLGILRHVHAPEHSADRREARETVQKLASRVQSDGQPQLATELRDALREAMAVDLRIRLKWVGRADLDLLVEEPNGARCDLRRRLTRNGGQLIQDDGGIGERPEGQRVEEYVCHSAPSGEYTAVVRFIFGNVVAGNAVLEVIKHEGTAQESKSSRTVQLSRQDARIAIELQRGRAD